MKGQYNREKTEVGAMWKQGMTVFSEQVGVKNGFQKVGNRVKTLFGAFFEFLAYFRPNYSWISRKIGLQWKPKREVDRFAEYRTGKKAMVGNNVSHSKRRTKRRFNVNLFSKKFYWVEQGCWISLNISAAGLRLINKMGLDAAIKYAVEKGYLTEIKMMN